MTLVQPPEQNAPPSIPIETLNRLAVSIIHEVSNPLSIIIGNAQYLLLSRETQDAKDSYENGELSTTVQAILNESMRLASLVSQLLSLSTKLTSEGASEDRAALELERFLGRLSATWPDRGPAE
jgi:signal transduction histidine kinase